MVTAPTPKPPPCAHCPHPRGVHTLTERRPRRRTSCTAWDDGAKCGCAGYEAAP